MCMARNDVRHALTQAGRATDRDAPEFAYWIRIATGHYFEAESALREWRSMPDIQAFIATIPEDGRQALKVTSGAIQKMGKGALEHSRNRTLHYPYPTSKYPTDHELSAALDTLGKEEVLVVSGGDGLDRLHFADHLALALALAEYDRSNLRAQGKIVGTGAWGFVKFATRAWKAYGDARGLELGLPASGD